MPLQPGPGYTFASFRVEVRERLLLRDGDPVPLTPKVFDTLQVLLENAGHVVSKQELMGRLWPDAVVEEANLSRNIFILRRALGDDQENPQYIETVPKLGYRFVAPVQTQATSNLEPPLTLRPHPSGARPWALIAVGITLLALAAGFLWWRPLRSRAHSPAGRIMLAVLPFQNLTGDPGQDFFSDGFTEEMIIELSQVQPQRLAVIARTSAMQYRNTHKGVDQIGRELAVQYVLEGSVRRAGDRVRITAQLIQVEDQTHLWAESYERDLSNVLQLQSKVAHSIARQIELQLSPQQASRLARTRRVEPQAYEAYLQGRYFWNQRSEEGFAKAIEYFDQAIARDPSAPEFYAGLADAYALMGSLPESALPRPQAMEKARAAALKALALDDSLAEAHTSLAFVEMHYDWDWPAAEREFLRALELNPGYATAHQWYAYYLIAMDHREEAVGEMRRAQELDPLSLIITRDVADMLYYSRRYDEAVEQCRETLERNPRFTLAHLLMGLAYQQKKDYPEMSKQYELAAAGAKDRAWALAALGQGEAALGHRLEAERILGELKRRNLQGQEVAYAIAVINVELGKTDEAFVWLDTAFQQRIGSLILLKADPAFDPVRQDPRFLGLLRRMRLQA